MSHRDNRGTIFLPTAAAVAIWNCEVTGQLSDGTWENTRPHNHWELWCDLDAKVAPGEPRVDLVNPYDGYGQKTNYNILSLQTMYERMLEPRMLKMGRFAKANGPVDKDWRGSVEYMSETMAEFLERRDGAKQTLDYVVAYLKVVTDEQAERYYATTYTPNELRDDLKAIKAAMKTVKH